MIAGWCGVIAAKDVELRRQQRGAEGFGLREPTTGVRASVGGRRDDAGVEEQARVPRVFAECAVHRALRVGRAACCRQGPGARVLREHVATDGELAIGQRPALGDLASARREEERDGARIGRRPVGQSGAARPRGLLIASSPSQRIGQRPLVFRQRIEVAARRSD